MAPVYKIAVIQLYPKPMQPAANFARAATYIRSAAAQGADLAVLPEYHLTNFLPASPAFRAACADWSSYLSAYQSLAAELSINIVPGTIIQTAPPEGTHPVPPNARDSTGADGRYRPDATGLWNVAYFIGASGAILGAYAKKNLWGPVERAHLTSSFSTPHPVIDTPLGPVGLLICWDLAFPEAWRELVAGGARLVIIPTFWTLNDCSEAGLKRNPSAEALFVDATLVARVFEQTVVVAFANAGGPPGRGYMGLSQVCMPFVGPVARLGGCEEGMAVVDVDMASVDEAEANYQVRADMASEGWHYEYRHDKWSEGKDKSKF